MVKKIKLIDSSPIIKNINLKGFEYLKKQLESLKDNEDIIKNGTWRVLMRNTKHR